MNRRYTLWVTLFLACVLSACTTSREINLEFPSNVAAALVDTTEIYVLESADGGECAEYLDDAFRLEGNDAVVVSSGPVNICEFGSSTQVTDSVPKGGHAYLVRALDTSNTVLFTGCRIFDPYTQEEESFVIQLAPTQEFSNAYPPCDSDNTCTVATDACIGGFCRPAGEQICDTLDNKCNNLCR